MQGLGTNKDDSGLSRDCWRLLGVLRDHEELLGPNRNYLLSHIAYFGEEGNEKNNKSSSCMARTVLLDRGQGATEPLMESKIEVLCKLLLPPSSMLAFGGYSPRRGYFSLHENPEKTTRLIRVYLITNIEERGAGA